MTLATARMLEVPPEHHVHVHDTSGTRPIGGDARARAGGAPRVDMSGARPIEWTTCPGHVQQALIEWTVLCPAYVSAGGATQEGEEAAAVTSPGPSQLTASSKLLPESARVLYKLLVDVQAAPRLHFGSPRLLSAPLGSSRLPSAPLCSPRLVSLRMARPLSRATSLQAREALRQAEGARARGLVLAGEGELAGM